MQLFLPITLFFTFWSHQGDWRIMEPRSFEESVISEVPSARELFEALQLELQGLEFEVFNKALQGYMQLTDQGTLQNPLLTIVDFTLASKEERMWVIDMEKQLLLYQTLVAHGKNSGEQYATRFSNEPNSNMSSLGFYLTGISYHGNHGLSLRLKGLEVGINDHAMVRNIVVHGADYVSEIFVKSHGRLGRSLGCPALPQTMAAEIIPIIADGSCFFIYSSANQYTRISPLLNP